MKAHDSNSSFDRAEIRHSRRQWLHFALLFAVLALFLAWHEIVEFPRYSIGARPIAAIYTCLLLLLGRVIHRLGLAAPGVSEVLNDAVGIGAPPKAAEDQAPILAGSRSVSHRVRLAARSMRN